MSFGNYLRYVGAEYSTYVSRLITSLDIVRFAQYENTHPRTIYDSNFGIEKGNFIFKIPNKSISHDNMKKNVPHLFVMTWWMMLGVLICKIVRASIPIHR